MQDMLKWKVTSTCQSCQMMLFTSFGQHIQSSLTGLWVLITIMQEEDYGSQYCSFENKVDVIAWGIVRIFHFTVCFATHTEFEWGSFQASPRHEFWLHASLSYFQTSLEPHFPSNIPIWQQYVQFPLERKANKKTRMTARISPSFPMEDYIDPFRG